MNIKINRIANIYFGLMVISGLAYTVFLAIASEKIMPGFVMQLIFLVDALKFGNNLTSVVLSETFILNNISGIIWLFLTIIYLKAINKAAGEINETNRFVNNLKIKESNPRWVTYHSDNKLIFTAGFFKPKVFVSTGVLNSHTNDEMKAMLWHEESHKINFHPLKIFITHFIVGVYPSFWGKKWVVDNYLTLTEVTSDQFSEIKIGNKLPLVSALIKFEKDNFKPKLLNNINYFNSQSERIKILVGQKKQAFSQPMIYFSIVTTFVLMGSLMISKSNIFFDCQHLWKCVEILVTPDSQSLIVQTSVVASDLMVAEHCLN